MNNSHSNEPNKKVPLMLAPMAGVTDSAFRIIVREVSGYNGLMFSEMVSSTGLHYKSQKTFEMLQFTEAELPISVQLFGSNPDYVAEAAQYVSQLKNVSAIDFNLGCPAPKIVKNGEGSALMKNPELTAEILRTIRRSTTLPVSVKMRLGFDSEHINAIEIAKIAEEAGVDSITVHGRTRDQFYAGTADWSAIAKVKQSVNIPVIANGDVRDFDSLDEIIKVTGCDGVMIGRAAMGNAWIFKRLRHYLDTGEKLPAPTVEDKFKILRRHLDLLLEFKGEYVGIREMRKHAAWYTKGLSGGSELRDKFNNAQTKSDFINIIDNAAFA
ncbi:MAG: tRNA dihydrouridine synthase DusB [Selenomonadaceae bacterium]|nr:tRNA dihydrouridine synthase DusB [Selenomonadaceae bacterium]MBR1859814.1 tRNA dihydrouridine synthase DusB [Selenomonadaceae bacterium]